MNGSTDMDGRIWLTKERMEKTVSGINKLQKGEEITKDEADALATFWHEVTHNKSKPGNMRMTQLQTKHMELANEFVSRNTLSEFYDAFGSKLQHAELVTNRTSTGYNRMVRNYQLIIEKTSMDKEKVIEKVKDHLFNKPYDKQKMGLTNALEGATKADGTKLTKSEINTIVTKSVGLSEDVFERYLDEFIR